MNPVLANIRALWVRFWVRRVKFNSRYADLDRLYAIVDPWQLSSSRERERFEKTNDLIRSIIPDCGTLLELGCGEGFQTGELMKVTRQLSGIDVSPRAVARAVKFHPTATLRVGQAEEVDTVFSGCHYDLATAFEVLYYSQDVPRVLAALQAIADRILVTSYAAGAAPMRQHFMGPGWRRLDDITAEGTVWECELWERSPT